MNRLSLAYGQVGRVRKYRTLFLVGRTRVHLDRVEDLGHFLELEVMLVDDESPEAGIREASDLMDRLGIQPSQLIEGAYLDLLLAQQGLKWGHSFADWKADSCRSMGPDRGNDAMLRARMGEK